MWMVVGWMYKIRLFVWSVLHIIIFVLEIQWFSPTFVRHEILVSWVFVGSYLTKGRLTNITQRTENVMKNNIMKSLNESFFYTYFSMVLRLIDERVHCFKEDYFFKIL